MVAFDVALRLAGGLVAVIGAVLTALIEIFYSPLRLGGTLVGLSILWAVVFNAALAYFAYHTTGRRWPVGVVAVAWFAVIMVASDRTTEGDLLMTSENWVALGALIAGSISFGVVGYRLVLRHGFGGGTP